MPEGAFADWGRGSGWVLAERCRHGIPATVTEVFVPTNDNKIDAVMVPEFDA